MYTLLKYLMEGCKINSGKINYADLNFKVLFMFFVMSILELFGIDEEVDEILYNELITMEQGDILKIFHHLMDLPVLTKSGKILLFEFKKELLRTTDFKQIYTYFKKLECQENRQVIPILITIPKGGNVDSYSTQFIKFSPLVLKTKSVDIQKDLLTIRDKFNNNQMLTKKECSLIIALPFFESDEDEGELIEEFCYYIKNNKENIPQDQLKRIVMGLYFDIVGYVSEDKQQELMEMINMATVYKGVVSEIKKEGERNGEIRGVRRGKRIGERRALRRVISRLLKNSSYPQVAKQLEMDEREVRKIMGLKV